MVDKKKKIESLLLLSCRSPFLDDDKIYVPMANLYLKSYINKFLPDVNVILADDDYSIKCEVIGTDGNQVKKYVLDKQGRYIFDDKTESLFKQFDAIGISIMTSQREEANSILKAVKDRWPEKIVIAGGPHVKHYLGDIIKNEEPYDYLVPLDGEKALLGILSGETDKFSHSYSRMSRDENRKGFVIGQNEDPRIINHFMTKEDILNQPRPDRSSKNAVDVIQRYHYSLGSRKSTTMMTSRGCPERCTFCFEGNTKIVIANGSNKKIKDIKIGDKVITFNNNKLEGGVVKKTFKRKVNKYLLIKLENNKVLKVTHEHLFYLKGKWVEAKNLKIGDPLHHITFKDKISFYAKNYNNMNTETSKSKVSKTIGIKIIGVKEVNEELEVYNFECDNNNYFAEYILVHNCEDAQTPVRWSSLENLIMEMDDIKNLRFQGVYIFDDLFAIALDKVRPIVQELKKRDLVYRCNSQARYFTKFGKDRKDFARLLSDTGCYEIAFGAETGSQKILDNIQKRTTVEMNYETVMYANEYGLVVKAYMLVGLPGEDKKTLKETEKFIDFLMNNPINGKPNERNDFGAYVYMPFKGTDIRDNIDLGQDIGLQMLVSEVSGAYGVKGGETAYEVRTPDLSAEEIKIFRNHLVTTYRPVSSQEKWKTKFPDTHLVTNSEYPIS